MGCVFGNWGRDEWRCGRIRLGVGGVGMLWKGGIRFNGSFGSVGELVLKWMGWGEDGGCWSRGVMGGNIYVEFVWNGMLGVL